MVGSIIAADEREPFMAVVFQLSPERIASLLFDTGAHGDPNDRRSRSAIGVGRASPSLLDAMARLLALLDQPTDVAALAPGTEREILWRLLAGTEGPNIRQIGVADSRFAHLTNAIRWIRDHCF